MSTTTTADVTTESARRPARSLAADVRFTLLTALGLALFPLVMHPLGGYAGLATQIAIVSVASVGFNLLLGYAGMLSYGQAMFYGGGGYVAAILLLRVMPQHPNLWFAMLAATVVTTVFATVIGALVVRLYGIYLALLTLAFSQMVYFVVEQSRDWTNGEDGLQSLPNPLLPIGPWQINLSTPLPSLDLGPFGDLHELKLWYVFAALVLLAVLVLTRLLIRSQFGEVLDAIRENEERSIFVGFNAAAYRLAAFAIAGGLAGLSGALKACYDSSIAVESVDIARSGQFVVYTIVGGVQTLFGPVVGTAVIMYLENVLSGKTDAWRLIEGVIFVLVIIFLPSGIIGTVQKRRGARTALARAAGVAK